MIQHQNTSKAISPATSRAISFKRAASKGLRGLLVFAQVVSTLSATLASMTQPTVLAPFLGGPLIANASTGQPTPVVAGNSVITVTKSVIGGTQSNFTVNITGPSYPSGASVPIVSGTQVITGLVSGVYTVTEVSPGAGWSTVYTASGVSSNTNAVVTLTNPAITATVAAGRITGTVYADFDADGNKDILETGVQSVTVTAYDKNNTDVGSTTTNITGTWSFTPTAAGPWRIEFTNLPSGYEPSRVAAGTQNGTSVQFVNSLPVAGGLYFGVNNPLDYCQNNPMLCVPEMIPGDPADTTFGAFSTLKKWDYSAAGGNVSPVNLANNNLVGTVWGLAYARGADKLYSAAFLKRHAGVGPSGIGAIYVTSNPRAGIGVTTSLFFDVATIAGVNLGTVPSNAARGLTSANGTASDAAIYDKVGKVGLGDIDISDDESMVWTVSLNDKKLIGVSVGNPSAATAQVYTIPDPGCAPGSGDYRPFATKYYRGNLYIGVTCDASISLLQNDLKSTVYRFDPANPGAGFTNVLNIPLNYVKGPANSACTSSPGARWFPWVNVPYPTGFNPACPGASIKVLPQPLLSDIEFDVDGSLILGFMDRFANQIAAGIALPDGTNVGEGSPGGDILRAWNNNGSLVLENNGTAGPVSGGVGTNQGPGGGEFYRGDFSQNQGALQEIANGGLAFLPGRGEVVTTVWDPFTNDATHGVSFLSNTNGNANRRHDLGANARFAKGAGLGDLELLCDSAPIEIGNRVWNDVNGNGIQDAGEPGIAGVTVQLRNMATGVVSTTATNASGAYYFSTVQANSPYSISIATGQSALSGLSLTTKDAQGNQSNDAIDDMRDSDATLLGTNAVIFYTTGTAGQNNHGLDFGFSKPPTATVAITNTAPPTLEVIKSVVGGSSSAAFPITVNGPGGFVSNTTVTAGTPTVFSNIAPGVYTVTEGTLPAAPTGLTWLAQPIYVPSDGVISVVGGTLAQVKITNVLGQAPSPTATLVLTKSVVGSTQTTYQITLSGPSYPGGQTFPIISGTNTITNLIPGVYTVTETSPGAGWTTTYTVSGTQTTTSGVVTLTNVITAAVVAPGRITGTVFNDYAEDGIYNSIGEGGVPSVTVTAYDRNGTAVGSTTTNVSGTYSFTPTASGPWRLEFTNLPGDYEPSRVFTSTGTGANGTSVQFVNSAPIGNVNFGILRPVDYSQKIPLAGVPEYSLGAAGAAFRLMDPSSGVNSVAATQGQIGGVWGEAWQRTTRTIFVAAASMGGVLYGPLGRGGIYAIDVSNIVTPVVTPYLDLTTLGVDVGVGVQGTTSTTIPGIGKTGLGDIEVSDDGQTLYVMNVYQRELVAVDIASKTLIDQIPVPDPGCLDSRTATPVPAPQDRRPWAVSLYKGDVYIGVVCSAETSGLASDLHYYIMRLSGNAFVPFFDFVNVPTVAFAGTWRSWLPDTNTTWVGTWVNGAQPLIGGFGIAPDGTLIVDLISRYNLAAYLQGQVDGAGGYENVGTAFAFPYVNGAYVKTPTPSGLIDTNGGMALIPGTSQAGAIVSSVGHSAGRQTLYPILAAGSYGYNLNGWSGARFKSANSGDVELLVDSAPIEIGNRVWNDVNGNGVQDPGEPAIAGVQVQLLDPTTNAVLQTVTTNISGTYYFTREASTGAYSQTLRTNTNYLITIAPTQTALSGYSLTTPDAQAISGSPSSNDAILDVRDSDAYLVGGVPSIYYTTGSAGQNNHGLDFGFVKSPTGAMSITNTSPPLVQFGDRAWIESDTDGLANTGTITTVVGLVITATNGTTTLTTTTNAQGYYSFSVPVGTYTVTYGAVPAVYGAVVPSATPSGTVASGNAGSYQQAGNPDASRPQNSTVTLAVGQSNWTMDYAFNLPPSRITVVKYTNGFDADAGSGPALKVGSLVTWTYVITNSGTTTLTNIGLSDDQQGSVSCPQSTLAIGASMTCVLTGVAVAGPYSNTAVVTGTPPSGTPVTGTNPSRYFGPNPGIVLRKYTNGYDADALPLTCNSTPNTTNQPCVLVGSTITWTYVVTNTGNMTLNIAAGDLNDDKVGPINAAAFSLAPGVSTLLTQTGIALAGQYTNTGIITGTPVLPPGTPITPDLPGFPPSTPVTNPVTSTNPSHYNTFAQFGDRVWIESDTDGVASTGTITPVQGMIITATDGTNTYTTTTNAQGYYSFTVQAGTYTVTYGAVPPSYGNVVPSTTPGNGTLSGNSGSYQQSGNPDQSHPQDTVVTVASGDANWQVDFAFNPPQPTIVVKKYTNGFDADSGNGPALKVGSLVTWTYVITNSGSTTLTNIGLNDDQQGSVTCPATTLAIGASMTCMLTGVAMAGPYSNTAVVTGTPPSGTPVTSTNPSRYFGPNPNIVLRKYTNGYDADALPLTCNVTGGQPCVLVGSTITWTYVVTNTGNVTLNIGIGDLNDDKVGPINASAFSLVPGQTTVLTQTGIAVAGQYTNTGIVTGTPVLPPGTPITPDLPGFPPSTPVTNPVTSTNPSHYNTLPQFGDRVWIESDKDGIASTGTITPVAGMVITATDGTTVYTTTTDAQGYYSFTVSAGTYTVTYGSVPASYGNVLPSATPLGSSTSGNAGSYREPNNPDQSRPQNSTVTLTPGQSNWTLDYAFNVALYDLGNKIWFDTNNDGQTGVFEVGVGGVTVQLRDANGGVMTTTTDASGYYSFTNLPAGTYSVTVAASNFAPGAVLANTWNSSPTTSPSNSASDNDTDHGVNPPTYATYLSSGVSSGPITLGAGLPTSEDSSAPSTPNGDANNNLTIDFGFYKQEIGNRVWYDNNGDGQDNNEPAASGILVTLTDSLGNVLSTTTTNAQGYYTFTGLPSGAFIVQILAPAGYGSTDPDDTTGNTDLNDNGQGSTSGIISSQVFTLTPGTNSGAIVATNSDGTTRNPSLDFGLARSGIDVIKYTNGYNADTLSDPRVRLLPGDPVTWTYVIRNLGSTALTNIQLSDDRLSIAGTTCAPVTLGSTLGVNGITTCTVTGFASAAQAVNGIYTNTATTQGNPPSGPPLTSTNPSHYEVITPSIGLRKYTNGYDSDTLADTRPQLRDGDAVTWTYVITNSGNVTLSNLTLNDDRQSLASANCAPVALGSSLAAGQVTTCTLSSNAQAAATANLGGVGIYTNTAVVTGTPSLPPLPPPDLPGFPPPPTSTVPLTATNPSHYEVVTPSIKVTKLTIGFDADTLADLRPLLRVGDPVTWTYFVTNTGNIPLNPVVLTDNYEGAITCPQTSLSAGASMTCTRLGTVQAAKIDAAGLYTNTAIVTGTPPSVPPPPPNFPPPPPPVLVTDTNPSHYQVVTPSITLVKYTNGYDADTLADARALLRAGDAVLWTYVIRNTGNISLSNLTLSDDRVSTAGASCAPVALGGTLVVSGVTTCSLSSTALLTQTVSTNGASIYTNTANTSGTPVVPPGNPPLPPLTATNPSHYEIFTPTIKLTKWTNGFDADAQTDPQPVLNLNDPVMWTFVFTNTSAVSLTNLALTDDREGNLNPRASCSPVNLGGTLTPGQSTTCTLTSTATGGQYVNNATVYGTPVLPPPPPPQFPPPPPPTPVTDTNPSRYFGAGPGLVLRKYTNGYDADVIPFDPQPFVLVGQPVTWTYVISNSGNVTLTNLTLNDDKIGNLNTNAGATCTPYALSTVSFPPGGVTTCTLPSTASVTGQYTNTAVVTGTNTLSPTQHVSSTNPSHYFGATPKIDVRKYTNGFDADTMNDPRAWLRNGDAVVWTYIVSNTGNVDLSNLTLSDDRINTAGASCAPVALGGTLAVGQVTTCTLPALAQANQTANGVYTNTVVVTGTPPLLPPPSIPNFPPTPSLPPPTATNPSHYEVVTPSIALTKWTNGYDADLLNDPQAQLVIGAAVTWTYRVTNTGTITLTNLTLVDDKEGGVTCPQSTLPPSASMLCTKIGFATLGQYTNTGVVTGTPSLPPYTPTLPGAPPPSPFPPISSTNPSHYNGITAGLGDFVFEDLDHDGYQDTNEPGIAGVSVKLLDSNGNVLRTTTTDANGYYSFTNLITGVPYAVQFGTPPPPGGGGTSYQPTTQNADGLGLNGAKNSDADPTTGRTVSVTLGANEFNPNLDAGFWRPASLGNYVWFDDNKDGTQGTSEPGVPGVRVNLYDASGLLIRTTTTDGNGYYSFTNLISGSYQVQFDVSTLPKGYEPTTQGATGSKDGPDSDPDPVSGRTELIPLSAGENDPTWDLGIVPKLAGLGNYVWSDVNRNGTQDANEKPVPGVLVTLYDVNGKAISTTTTDINGFYIFTELMPGTYSVGFTAPNGFMFTTPGSTPSSDTDSNANPQTGRTQPVVLGPGEYNPTIDAGLVPLASLGDFVWNDQNHDGKQDPGEPGVQGVTVTLKDGNGQVIATTTTNASGAYSFTNLIPGTYVVVFTLPPGDTFTKPNVGNDSSDSDAVPEADVLIGVVPPVTLQPGENNPTIDAGVWVPARLGDFVWYDVNRNGVQDVDEMGVPGVTVTLYQRGNVLSTTVTTADGRYLFDNLIPGDYYVVFTLPNGFTFTQQTSGNVQSDSNADPVTGQSSTTTIDPGEDDRTWDAGIWLPLPTLNIRKTAHTAGASVKQGDLVSYTIVVSNNGAGVANNVVITDPLPSSLLYEPGSAKPAAIYANRTLTWTKATLRPGERFTMTFQARVQTLNDPNATQIVNLAYTSATGPDNVPVFIVPPPLRDDDQANVPLAPNFVTLSSFTAKWVTNTVKVNWVTSEEINTFGFTLLRAQSNNIGAAVQLFDTLVPARGANGGASYDFVDTSVDTSRSDIVYYYWLQETETNGKINVYGPIKSERQPINKPTKYVVFLPMLNKGK